MPAGFAYDGRVRVHWLPDDPTDLDAPTLAELNAGEDLSGYVVPDGVDYGTGNSRVEGRDALTSFDNQSMGRHQAAPSIMFKSKLVDDSELAWTTLKARLTFGCLIIFEDVPEGSAAGVGDVCDVYPSCQTGAPLRQNTAINTERKFKVDFAVGEAPHLGAIITAS